MAKYLNNKGKQRSLNLCTAGITWNIEEIYEEDLEESKDEQWIAVSMSDFSIDDYFEDANPLYPDEYCSCAKYIKLYYDYAEDDTLKLHPIATKLTYPAFESICDDAPNFEYEKEVSLNKKEIAYFSKLLHSAIGDKHDPKMQKVMTNYHNAVDPELKDFVQDVMSDRDVLPITVGFVTEKMAEDIQYLTGINTIGRRIVVSADVIHDILNGSTCFDRSVLDKNDIA